MCEVQHDGGMSPAAPLILHPDRLLPADPGVRAVARELYQSVQDLPILSPHGHVDAQALLDDAPFADPATLFVTPDHYVTRLLHATGIPLDALGVGQGRLAEPDARAVWRALCSHWEVYRGTPVRFWLEAELAEIFGVDVRPSAATADAIYDRVAGLLATDPYRPRALYDRFGIAVMATTDDPCDDLSAHAGLRADRTWTGRVVPTFRPDRHLEPGARGWRDAVTELGDVSGVDTGTYAGWVQAMEARRAYFRQHGAVSADHSHEDVRTDPLDTGEAERIYQAARTRRATSIEAVALRRHMLLEMARMSCDDGLVMTLHPGVPQGHR
jgi:glucuronate isomerase